MKWKIGTQKTNNERPSVRNADCCQFCKYGHKVTAQVYDRGLYCVYECDDPSDYDFPTGYESYLMNNLREILLGRSPKYKGEPLPTLEEFIEYMRGYSIYKKETDLTSKRYDPERDKREREELKEYYNARIEYHEWYSHNKKQMLKVQPTDFCAGFEEKE